MSLCGTAVARKSVGERRRDILVAWTEESSGNIISSPSPSKTPVGGDKESAEQPVRMS